MNLWPSTQHINTRRYHTHARVAHSTATQAAITHMHVLGTQAHNTATQAAISHMHVWLGTQAHSTATHAAISPRNRVFTAKVASTSAANTTLYTLPHLLTRISSVLMLYILCIINNTLSIHIELNIMYSIYSLIYAL